MKYLMYRHWTSVTKEGVEADSADEALERARLFTPELRVELLANAEESERTVYNETNRADNNTRVYYPSR